MSFRIRTCDTPDPGWGLGAMVERLQDGLYWCNAQKQFVPKPTDPLIRLSPWGPYAADLAASGLGGSSGIWGVKYDVDARVWWDAVYFYTTHLSYLVPTPLSNLTNIGQPRDYGYFTLSGGTDMFKWWG
jgi:hypothetical protein